MRAEYVGGRVEGTEEFGTFFRHGWYLHIEREFETRLRFLHSVVPIFRVDWMDANDSEKDFLDVTRYSFGLATFFLENLIYKVEFSLSDERGRWLFDPAHSEASSELALTGVRGADIVNVIIDRTFVDAEGIRWVVDFKTSPHEGGDREAFLDEEVKRYRGQLQRYAHFARGLGPQPVRAGLYYPLLGEWREVPV